MARTTKKRQQQLKHDKFRDETFKVVDRLGDRLEGKGRLILYALAGLVALVVLYGVYSWWAGRRADEASHALGRAIETAEAPVTSGTPIPGQTGPSFPSERERAQKAVEQFDEVINKYGDPYREMARYFKASALLTLERPRGLSELQALTGSGNRDVAARAKFALAQAREADGQFDDAANLYNELLNDKDSPVARDTVNLRLASVYERQGKRDAASDILFRMLDEARKAKGKDGKPLPETASVREADTKLETLNPERYAQLPPKEATTAGGGDLPLF